jgi:hypothetical protein
MQKVIETKKPSLENKPNLQCAPKGSSKIFDIMFLHEDEGQSVEVVESSMIDFNRLIEHLGQGNSVFIAPKKEPVYTLQKKKRKTQKSIYLKRI